MQHLFLIISFVTAFISLISSSNNFSEGKDCVFVNPDTSLSGIKIRDPNSTIFVLGPQIKLGGDSTHNFYSKKKDQVLRLTIHPGDYFNQVSIFQIRYTGKNKQTYPKSNLENFKTEKGICLGVSKEYVLSKLGKCYKKSQQGNSEMISYRLESPKDSKTKLLERHNMPIYFAVYYFKNNKLAAFDFGFEYP